MMGLITGVWILAGAVTLGLLSPWGMGVSVAGVLALGGAYVMGTGVTIGGYEVLRLLDKLRHDLLASARFGTKGEMKAAGLHGQTGVLLGKYKGHLLRYDKPGHLVTFAKTRGGKGVSCVIPNLLSYTGAVFCMDIKGENHAITARRRRDFGPVYLLAPFDDQSHHYNPLDFVRPGADEIDDASLIATLIVVPSGPGGEDAFWDKEARALMTGLILYVVRHMPREKRTLAELRHLLTLPPDEFDTLLDTMAASPHWWIKRAAGAFRQKADKERSGVISTAQSHTKVFDSPRLARVTSDSDFQLEDLKHQVMSLFVSIPPHQLAVYRPWLRLMVGLTEAAMTRNPMQPEVPVLFLLDEFPSLGKMPVNGFAYLAGYGVRLWVFSQSMGQLEAAYGQQTQTILSNCAVTQSWSVAPADIKTAEALSRTLGKRQVTLVSETRASASRFAPTARHWSDSRSPQTRPLLTPDEILCLPDACQLLLISGARPFLVERLRYYTEQRFADQYDGWTQKREG